MSRKQIATELAPGPAGPYSQAIAANGFLYTRTTVGSYLGDFLVEIDVVAVVP